LDNDRILSPDIIAIREGIENGSILSAAEASVQELRE